MEFKYFDIHSHINFSQYDKDRKEVIKRMTDEGVGTICIGTDLKTSKECVDLADKYKNIWATVGIHPTDSEEDFSEKEYEKLLGDKIVAIGECGLDYFHPGNIEKQKELFERQIKFAVEKNLPIMIHARGKDNDKYGVYRDILEILKKYEGVRGNVHFFAGDIEIAKEFLNISFTLSFTAVLLLTKEYDEVVKYVPLDKMMAETDSPFVSPLRGKRNEPVFVKEVVKLLKLHG